MKGVYRIRHEFKRGKFCDIDGMKVKGRRTNAATLLKFISKSLNDDGIPFNIEVTETQTIYHGPGAIEQAVVSVRLQRGIVMKKWTNERIQRRRRKLERKARKSKALRKGPTENIQQKAARIASKGGK